MALLTTSCQTHWQEPWVSILQKRRLGTLPWVMGTKPLGECRDLVVLIRGMLHIVNVMLFDLDKVDLVLGMA